METVTENPITETQAAIDAREQARRTVAQLAAEFKMPHVEIGDDVLWWPKADKSKPERLAQVQEVWGPSNAIVVRLIDSGMTYDSCRHIDDPKLVENPNLRDDGGWDFTASTKQRWADEKALEERLQRLEAARAPGVEIEKELKEIKRRLTQVEKKQTVG